MEKKYIKGRLEFDGEYLFDRKWNGKGYDEKGNIIYELINGNGKIKEYNELNEDCLEYEGEYLNGKRNGKGKEYFLYSGEIKFEGEFLNDQIWNGRGFTKNKEVLYEIKDGKGIIKEYDYWGNLIFEGEYLNGERSGKGKEFIQFKNTLVYEGEYLYGKEMDLEKDI